MVSAELIGLNVSIKKPELMSPEVICATFARTSRDPRSLNQIYEDALNDVPKARQSNKAIIFGMGHKSIAEHGVFNYIIQDLSRLSVEYLESHRLCSYTEKSQRYITLNGDYVTPKELIGSGFEKEYHSVVRDCNDMYSQVFPELIDYFNSIDNFETFKQMGINDKVDKQKTTIEGWAKEDARYIIPLSTSAQLGLTVSARNLENIISEMRSSNIFELNSLGEQLFNQVSGVAPSVVKYTEKDDYFSKTKGYIKTLTGFLKKEHNVSSVYGKNDVIMHSLPDDDSIIAAMIFGTSNLSFSNALELSNKLSFSEKKELVNASLIHKQSHDPMLRFYELGGFKDVFEISLSSSAFAQLKRHRMNTIIPQSYDINLGNTIPESVKMTHYDNDFMSVIKEVNDLYSDLKDSKFSNVADYVLTNSHKRNVLIAGNIRQLHSVALERLNVYAQWDIKDLTRQVIDLAKNKYPLTLATVAGKHEHDIKKDLFLNSDVESVTALL